MSPELEEHIIREAARFHKLVEKFSPMGAFGLLSGIVSHTLLIGEDDPEKAFKSLKTTIEAAIAACDNTKGN